MSPRGSLAHRALVASLALAVMACSDRDASATRQGPGAVNVPRPADVQATPPLPARFRTIGHDASRADLQRWNIDVNPVGSGLPPGRGTAATGATLFAQKCAACHGARGEGMGPYPRLIGRDPRDGFPFGQDLKYVKTIGNYWPYATTIYDYVNRAMPLTAPGSLRPDEIYSLTAFLLAENQIIDRSAVMDARSLPAVRMPARDRFVVDDRKPGAGFR